MECKNVYYQGEDIVMRLTGNEVVNLDKADFVLGLYQGGEVIRIEKAECRKEAENVWRAVVGKAKTATMSLGKWDVELKVSNEVTSITSASNVITIVKSVLG